MQTVFLEPKLAQSNGQEDPYLVPHGHWALSQESFCGKTGEGNCCMIKINKGGRFKSTQIFDDRFTVGCRLFEGVQANEQSGWSPNWGSLQHFLTSQHFCREPFWETERTSSHQSIKHLPSSFPHFYRRFLIDISYLERVERMA